jgi:hypothetical protein
MRPKPPVRDVPDDLFRQRLTSIIDARHPLVLLAARIDWAALETCLPGASCPSVAGLPCRCG